MTREAVLDAPPIRVVVAGDQSLFREGVAEICRLATGLSVVGQADNRDDAIAVVHRERPDVVLLDVQLPGPDADLLLAEILRAPSTPRVVILTMHDNPRLVSRLLAAGAQAYISRTSSREQLLAAIRAVGGNRDRVVLSMPKSTAMQLREGPTGPLSSRQLTVLDLAAQGLGNAQIARRLDISEGTVKRHLTNCYLKLGVVSRMTAVNKATAMRLLPPRA
jgi:DNA-binding NarL/FixJ family response regulator